MEQDEKIRVILLRPGEEAVVTEMRDDLSSMQEMVGGPIEEYMPFEDEVAIVCNEEGKMNGMPLNRAVYGEDGQMQDIIAGPFFLCYAPIESEKFLSMPEDLEEKYRKRFEWPERFFRTNDGIRAVKFEPPAKEKTSEKVEQR
jgi:hypothetical protein